MGNGRYRAKICYTATKLYSSLEKIMSVATIQIQVDDNIIKAYETAPEARRQRLQALIGTMLQDFAETTPQSLLSLMDDMSREAKANGLTPDILDSLLQDD